MKCKLLAAILAAVVVFGGCASSGRVSIPKEDLVVAGQAGTAILTKFSEHYITLFEEGRGPTDAEFGYWTGALENVYFWSVYLRAKLENVPTVHPWVKLIFGVLFEGGAP